MQGVVQVSLLELSQQANFWGLIEAFGFIHDRSHYARCVERQQAGELDIVLAHSGGETVGFCVLNYQPRYAYFKKCGLPEVQDLNVLRQNRRQGIGRKVIEFCEECARHKGYEEMGIGVGLDSSFGAAQRLYAAMGYIPDGAGLTYDRKLVAVGEFRPIDENLCLMMTKKLG